MSELNKKELLDSVDQYSKDERDLFMCDKSEYLRLVIELRLMFKEFKILDAREVLHIAERIHWKVDTIKNKVGK